MHKKLKQNKTLEVCWPRPLFKASFGPFSNFPQSQSEGGVGRLWRAGWHRVRSPMSPFARCMDVDKLFHLSGPSCFHLECGARSWGEDWVRVLAPAQHTLISKLKPGTSWPPLCASEMPTEALDPGVGGQPSLRS